MLVNTKFFGEVDVNENKIVTITNGLLGFENLTKYVLIPHDKDNMFKWFQSVEDVSVCFLVVEPVTFMLNYSLEISDEVVERLSIKVAEDVITYALVVIPDDPLKISANLCGPLVINMVNRLGMQVVSMNPHHQVKHFIIEELKANTTKLMQNVSMTFGQPAPPATEPSAKADDEKKNEFSIFESAVTENSFDFAALNTLMG